MLMAPATVVALLPATSVAVPDTDEFGAAARHNLRGRTKGNARPDVGRIVAATEVHRDIRIVPAEAVGGRRLGGSDRRRILVELDDDRAVADIAQTVDAGRSFGRAAVLTC